MGFIAKDTGGKSDFRPAPPGNYVARCIQVIDLGTQTGETRYGQQSKRKLRLVWEVFGEDDDGKPLTVTIDGKQMPMTVGRDYTLSLHENAALRADLVAWRGRQFTVEEARGFDVLKLLGAYCMLNVGQNISKATSKPYATVEGISPLPKALAASKPDGVHELTSFDIEAPDMDLFNKLPKFIQDTIRQAPEFSEAKSTAAAPAGDDIDDDVPF